MYRKLVSSDNYFAQNDTRIQESGAFILANSLSLLVINTPDFSNLDADIKLLAAENLVSRYIDHDENINKISNMNEFIFNKCFLFSLCKAYEDPTNMNDFDMIKFYEKFGNII